LEIDRYIQPSDSQVFADCLVGVDVERFEIDAQPRSFAIRFEFSENPWFEDKILEKKFWVRRAADNWTGLVSEPVKIHWKKDMDLTHGVTDAAVKLWESSKKMANGAIGMGKAKGTPEYDALVKKLESSDMSMSSFFTLFSYISAKRFVSADESAKANAAEADRRKRRAAGEKVDEPVEDDTVNEDVDTMVCPYGDDLATFLAEDLFPNAIKYFSKLKVISSHRITWLITFVASAQEHDDEPVSEEDFEMGESSDDESDQEVDIRALVKGKSQKRKEKSTSDVESPPPTTRVRTSK
jgi:hypothetical protein